VKSGSKEVVNRYSFLAEKLKEVKREQNLLGGMSARVEKDS